MGTIEYGLCWQCFKKVSGYNAIFGHDEILGKDVEMC